MLSTAERWRVVVESAQEVGPALFFSLLIITVAFLPVFTLEGQEGRLFKPLAFTKTFSMAAASLLSVTLVPVPWGCSSAAGSTASARTRSTARSFACTGR